MASEIDVKPQSKPEPIDVAVIGLGLMGRSIAACLLSAGHRVFGIDNDSTSGTAIMDRVRALLSEMQAEDLLGQSIESVMSRFRLAADVSSIVSCELVIESVTEDLELKRSIFHDIEKVVPASTIIASN